MGCHKEKYCRKLSDILAAFPLVLRSHTPAQLWEVFLDSSGFVDVLLFFGGPAYKSRNN